MIPRTCHAVVLAAAVGLGLLSPAAAAEPGHWATTWAAADQGPYPVGSPTAQPRMDFAIPDATKGATDQTFRLVVRPSIWGERMRIRLSNALGKQPVSFDGVHVGLQASSATLLPGTNRPVTFSRRPSVTLAPGELVWSDPVDVPLGIDPASPLLAGRNLAVSFHVVGSSGPMTWHAKALTTSYLTPPGSGSHGAEEAEDSFVFPTASWYFLDAVDVMAPADTEVVVAMGDSITDGSATTINGHDRWPDALARRLRALHGNRVAVVNTAIAGNQILGPAVYDADHAYAGGPALIRRLDRDVLALSGVTSVIWLEGINDFSKNGNASFDAVEAGMTEIVGRLRRAFPQVRVTGATLTSTIGTTIAWHGFPEQDEARRRLNDFIRTGPLFDAHADFDAATFDAATGRMRPEFLPESSTGGAGDGVHPNRVGYLAMAKSVDLDALLRKK